MLERVSRSLDISLDRCRPVLQAWWRGAYERTKRRPSLWPLRSLVSGYPTFGEAHGGGSSGSPVRRVSGSKSGRALRPVPLSLSRGTAVSAGDRPTFLRMCRVPARRLPMSASSFGRGWRPRAPPCGTARFKEPLHLSVRGGRPPSSARLCARHISSSSQREIC